MGFFDHKHEKESPIGNLRAHIGTFMYFVKVGKSKFKNKGRVGEIFADMDNTQYLFQQATSGTMYDMKKKLDYALWDAAVHKYTEDLGELKKELLKAVDEGAETDTDVFEEKEEEVVEQPVQEEEEGDWKAHIKGQMEEAEEKARQEAERKRHEESTPASNKSDDDEHMTEDLKRLKENGIQINYFHSEDEGQVKELMDAGVNFILTDRLSKMLQAFDTLNSAPSVDPK